MPFRRAALAFGGQPAIPLATTGYLKTLTGDYSVDDNLPPFDKPELWNEFYQVTLNGQVCVRNSGDGRAKNPPTIFGRPFSASRN